VTRMPEWTRPIRIPESVKITHTDPPYALAGETSTWRLPFELSKDVAPGSVLWLQVFGGRNNKGTFRPAQAEHPAQDGYITARLADGTALRMRRGGDGTLAIDLPETGLRKDDAVAVTLGDPSGGGAGIETGPRRTLNKLFVLYTETQEEKDAELPAWAGSQAWGEQQQQTIVAVCTMHVLGGPLARLCACVPSQCEPGDTIPVLVRPEDEHRNLSDEPIDSVEVSLDDEPLDAEIEPVPGSTCLRVSVTLDKPGTYRLCVREPGSALSTLTNPIVCGAGPDAQSVFWGMIHGHTEMSDGTGTLEQYFHQLRHEVALDFAAPGDHDHRWETPDALWRVTCEAVRRWHAPGEFVTFLGYEWAKWRQNGDGDRNVYYLADDRPMYRSGDSECESPPDLFRALEREKETAIVIPHHTGHGGNFCDWKHHSPAHERLVEIFQTRGSYECEDDDNPAPERPTKYEPYPAGTVRNALAMGWRVGFTAGGDDHSGAWGTEALFRDEQGRAYKQGLMSVQAEARTREAIWQALHDRRVVATTGTRILLDYTVAGRPMGSELSVKDSPALATERVIRVDCHGTAALDRIDIVRCNQVVRSEPGEGRTDVAFEWKDAEPLDKICLPPAKFCEHTFAFYYVRAVQTDGEVAWASPVWIDP